MPKAIVKKEKRYVIEDLPTQTIPVIVDKFNNEKYDMQSALMLILEELNELKEMAKGDDYIKEGE